MPLGLYFFFLWGQQQKIGFLPYCRNPKHIIYIKNIMENRGNLRFFFFDWESWIWQNRDFVWESWFFHIFFHRIFHRNIFIDFFPHIFFPFFFSEMRFFWERDFPSSRNAFRHCLNILVLLVWYWCCWCSCDRSEPFTINRSRSCPADRTADRPWVTLQTRFSEIVQNLLTCPQNSCIRVCDDAEHDFQILRGRYWQQIEILNICQKSQNHQNCVWNQVERSDGSSLGSLSWWQARPASGQPDVHGSAITHGYRKASNKKPPKSQKLQKPQKNKIHQIHQIQPDRLQSTHCDYVCGRTSPGFSKVRVSYLFYVVDVVLVLLVCYWCCWCCFGVVGVVLVLLVWYWYYWYGIGVVGVEMVLLVYPPGHIVSPIFVHLPNPGANNFVFFHLFTPYHAQNYFVFFTYSRPRAIARPKRRASRGSIISTISSSSFTKNINGRRNTIEQAEQPEI